MTPEERWTLIEEKHLALTDSLELLTHDVHDMQDIQKRIEARERQAREALLSGIAAYLRALKGENGEA